MFHCTVVVDFVKTDGSQCGKATRIVDMPFVPHIGMFLHFDKDKPSHEVTGVSYFVGSRTLIITTKQWEFHEHADLVWAAKDMFGPDWSFELVN